MKETRGRGSFSDNFEGKTRAQFRKWFTKFFFVMLKIFSVKHFTAKQTEPQWVLPGGVADVLRCWWNGLGRHSSDVWNLVPLCVMCLIWKERNCRTFEDISSSESQLIESFATTLFDWSRTWGFSSTTTVIEFISFLSLSHDIVLT